jgi:hypothetical protein
MQAVHRQQQDVPGVAVVLALVLAGTVVTGVLVLLPAGVGYGRCDGGAGEQGCPEERGSGNACGSC